MEDIVHTTLAREYTRCHNRIEGPRRHPNRADHWITSLVSCSSAPAIAASMLAEGVRFAGARGLDVENNVDRTVRERRITALMRSGLAASTRPATCAGRCFLARRRQRLALDVGRRGRVFDWFRNEASQRRWTSRHRPLDGMTSLRRPCVLHELSRGDSKS